MVDLDREQLEKQDRHTLREGTPLLDYDRTRDGAIYIRVPKVIPSKARWIDGGLTAGLRNVLMWARDSGLDVIKLSKGGYHPGFLPWGFSTTFSTKRRPPTRWVHPD